MPKIKMDQFSAAHKGSGGATVKVAHNPGIDGYQAVVKLSNRKRLQFYADEKLSYWNEDDSKTWIKINPDCRNIISIIGVCFSSNAEDVFDFYDNCELGVATTKYMAVGGSASFTYTTSSSYNGTRCLSMAGTLSPYPTIVAKNVNVRDAIFEAWVKHGARDQMIVCRSSMTTLTYYGGRPNYNGFSQIYKRVNGTFTLLNGAGIASNLNVWQYAQIICSGSSIRYIVNGVELCTATDSENSSGSIGFAVLGESIGMYADLIRVRKYSPIEPILIPKPISKSQLLKELVK